MPLFEPDTALFADRTGFGFWRLRHNEEHAQFSTLLGGVLPQIDLLTWRDDPDYRRIWLTEHYLRLHLPLRQITGVDGIDLSAADFGDEDSWYDWHDEHASEHEALRAALGIA